MKIGDSFIMGLNIAPDSHGMLFVAVKGTVHELHLGHLMINKKLQFFFHKGHIPQPHFLIYRRQAVAAGKGTSSAGLIINDLILEILHLLIDERHFVQIHYFTPPIIHQQSAFPVNNPPDILKLSTAADIILHQLMETFFSLTAKDPGHTVISLQAFCGIIRHFRTAKPYRHLRP